MPETAATPGEGERGGDGTDTDDGSPTPSDAFGALGNEVRTRTLAALLEDGTPAVRRFSELFEASGAETSAGFAYHLRKLTDRYLEEVEEGYTLTYAGTQVARDIVSGEVTESFDREAVAIDDPCPFCGATALAATARDNTVAVRCGDCDRTLLRLPFPPGGFRTHDDEELPAAVDRLHRHRVGLMAAGSCPECGGATTVRTERSTAHEPDTEDAGESPPPRLRLACEGCAYTLRCPVTLGVLDHPAVVAFYHDHGLDVRDRPIWNVGAEWRETVLSTDPWCVRVSAVIDGEGLELFVARDGRVVDHDRFEVGAAS